jgi:hypothetical protein
MGVRRGRSGQMPVRTVLPTPGLEPTLHTTSSYWSVPQHIGRLHISMASQATVDTTASFNIMVRMLVHCPNEDVWQTGHIHFGCPSQAVILL